MHAASSWPRDSLPRVLIYVTVLKSISIYVHNYVVQCPGLTEPINGMMSCSIANGQMLSYEDTCSFTCNTGYEPGP